MQEEDTLIIWEDNILPEACETPILDSLRKNSFPSKLKTILWRLICLMISKIEENINEFDFDILVKRVLTDFTTDANLVDQMAGKTGNLLRRLETYNPLVEDLKAYNICKDKHEHLRAVTQEQNEYFKSAINQGIFQYPPLKMEDFLNVCDFSLSGRLKLVLISVIAEMGFNEFSFKIEQEFEKMRKEQGENNNTLSVYENLKSCVLNNVLYLTRYTYGAIYNRLYIKDIKTFVDKL